MLVHPNFDPVAIALGPIKVHWYGLSYLVGFTLAWALGRYRARQADWPWNKDQISDLLFYAVLGIILGGRLGSVFFYNFEAFLADPTMIYKVWQGGMSFHGGLIGVIVCLMFFARKTQKAFWEVGDMVVV
ncbi:MAG: prolipoprotein diacylglyceryl transferase, partial [Abyssibacter sp.]